MSKITKLTESQEALIPKYRDEFLNIGLSTEPGNRDVAKENIFRMYEILGMERPKYFYWFDSPLAAILAANILSLDFKGDHLRGQIGDHLRGHLWVQLSVQLSVQLRDQLGGHLGDHLRGHLWVQLGGQIRDQLRDQLGGQIGDQLRVQLGDQLSVQLWDQLRGQLSVQLRDQLSVQLSDQLWDQLSVQLSVQLSDQLWDQLSDQLRDQLRGQLWDQLSDQLSVQLKKFNVWRASFGQFEAYWLSFYSFINEVLPVNKAEGIHEAREIIKNTSYYICYKNAVIASDKPCEIHFNDRKQLHNQYGPAIKYKDGYSVYAFNGVRFTDNEWVYTDKRDGDFYKRVLQIKNTEVRYAAMQMLGKENFLDHLNAEKIHEMGDYRLYYLTIEGNKLGPYLWMRCPSSGREFLEGVGDAEEYDHIDPNIKTVEDALKYRAKRAADGMLSEYKKHGTWEFYA